MIARRLQREALLDQLHEASPAINPSLLLCDFAHLADEVHRMEDAGARVLHLDVMDGHFVPNMTYGMTVVAAVRRITRLPLDVHLMIERPERYLREFRDAGADLMTVHAEAAADPASLLDEIRRLGAAAGLAINPPTPLSTIEPLLPRCDLVLSMSVAPGFGKQQFDPVALEKIRELRSHDGPPLLLEVDGGINRQTLGRCVEAGADLLVVGSAIFKAADPQASFHELEQLAQLPT